jgi:RNA polymerase sigma factor (sigma-70 family)
MGEMTAAAIPDDAPPEGMDPRVAVLFEELEPLLRQGLFSLGAPVDVDDAIGETFTYLCANADRIIAMENPRGYLYRVARDKVRGSRRLQLSLPPVRPELQPEVDPELVRALGRLRPAQRTAVFLHGGLGWTWDEVAEFLGASVSTVRTHYRRGMKKLRSEMGEVD